MTEEISLSIEETNKLRVSIGLEPIPVPGNQSSEVIAHQETAQLVPKPTKAGEELSIEETNKLRLSLGLKPIPVDENLVASREENEVKNFQRHQSEIRDKERDDEIKQRIDTAKARNLTRKRLAAGKTLLSEVDKDGSTDDWLKKLGQPKGPAKRQKMQTDESIETNGLRVGHNSKELSTLKNNEILTLKDIDVLGEEGDELTNEALVRDARFKKELQDKVGAESVKNNGRTVRGFQMGEDNNDNDEDEDNMMITDATIKLSTKDHAGEENSTDMESSKGHVKISNLFSDVEASELQPASDYSKPKKPIKMKKLKKKTTQNSRNKTDDAKDEEEITSIKPVELEVLDPAELLADDSELNSVLSMKRNLKQKNRKHMTPEQIAQEVKLFRRWDEEKNRDDISFAAQKDNGGIVYNDTSDFLNSLSVNVLENTGDEKSNSNGVNEEPEIKSEPKIKQEDDENLLANNNPAEMEASDSSSVKKEDEAVNHEENTNSPSFNGGLASTLKFLQSRQILQKQTDDEYEKAKQQREALKQAELLKLKISIESRMLREYLEADKSYMNLPKEEREEIFESHLDQVLKEKNIISNITNSHRGARKPNKPSINENLATYNPDVKLSYRDESGTELNTKEAFKYLSHKFHGVGPGKGKIDKKLKKIQQQRDKNSSSHEGII